MNDAVQEVGGEGPRRRGVLLAGVAAAAAAAGAGFALWRMRESEPVIDAGALLWPLSFQTPQGQTLAMTSFKGRPLLVNFWATWCPPCVEELPLLDAFYRQNSAKGWQVVGLAIDQPAAVRTFLQRIPVSFVIGMAGLEGTDLSKKLGNLVGGLPFSIVLGSDGVLRQRRMGRLTAAELQQWASIT